MWLTSWNLSKGTSFGVLLWVSGWCQASPSETEHCGPCLRKGLVSVNCYSSMRLFWVSGSGDWWIKRAVLGEKWLPSTMVTVGSVVLALYLVVRMGIFFRDILIKVGSDSILTFLLRLVTVVLFFSGMNVWSLVWLGSIERTLPWPFCSYSGQRCFSCWLPGVIVWHWYLEPYLSPRWVC